jgi:hypothetical protein
VIGGIGSLVIAALWFVLFPEIARMDALERGRVSAPDPAPPPLAEAAPTVAAP